MPRLPNLKALHAFDAAARHLSFTRAAAELHVTQGAVSRMVRLLEQEVGARLFDRSPTGVTLTAAGARFAAGVADGFGRLRAAAAEVRRDAPALVRVGLLSSFATYWLMPRLPAFAAAHPGVEVELWPDHRPTPPGRDGIDLAVRYGTGPWSDGRHELLLAERLVPVASPDALARCRGEPLDELPLLSSSRTPHGPDGEIDWRAWADAAGRPLPEEPRRWSWCRDYPLAVAAALNGGGALMARLNLVGGMVEDGCLVRLSPVTAEGTVGHHLVLPLAPPSHAAALFADWLRREAGTAETGQR